MNKLITLALLPMAGALAQEAPIPTDDPAVVIVSARKRDEAITDVPVAVTAFGPRTIADYNLRSFPDYAVKVPNLSFAYGNGTSAGETGTATANARTIAIRGISGARTTGYYIDDTPLPGAIDLRLVDMAGIEVLKGPQGTLFGESSLGGNVRLLSRAPDLQRPGWSYRAEAGHTQGSGSANAGASAIGNLVLSPGSAALRFALFGEHQGGYLTRDYLSNIGDPASTRVRLDDQGAQRNWGVSVTALMRLSDRFDLTLRLLHQDQTTHGIAATYAPLPAFEPVRNASRLANIEPRASDSWSLPTATLAWHGDGWELHSSTSYFTRKAYDLEDSSEGTTQYLASYGQGTPAAQPFAWSATRDSRQLTHETRLTFQAGPAISGTAGIYYANMRSNRNTPAVYGQNVLGKPGSTLLWIYSNDYQQDDLSLFGELYVRLGERWTATLGERAYRLSHQNKTVFDGALYGVPFSSNTDNKDSGNSPKLALSWQPSKESIVYASATKGYRSGGSQADLSPFLGGCVSNDQARRLAHVDADSLWSYELGAKLDLPQPGLLLTGALYQIDWKNIQQPAFVPACAFYLLGNAGAAKIKGGEFEATGRLTRELGLRFGVGYEDARISEQGSSQQPVGARIKQVPQWNAALGATYTTPIRPGLTGFLEGDYSYMGDSVSSNATSLALVRPSYTLLNLRIGARWDKCELTFDVKNAGNSHPNLGDLGYLGYQRFEADGKTPLPMVATLPPRTFSVQFRQRF